MASIVRPRGATDSRADRFPDRTNGSSHDEWGLAPGDIIAAREKRAFITGGVLPVAADEMPAIS